MKSKIIICEGSFGQITIDTDYYPEGSFISRFHRIFRITNEKDYSLKIGQIWDIECEIVGNWVNRIIEITLLKKQEGEL